MMGKTVALVVAAGRGRRFGGDLPKQYARLGGQTVLRRTLCALLFDDQVDHVCCVIHPDDEDLYAAATEGLDLLPAVTVGRRVKTVCVLDLKALRRFRHKPS